MIKPMLNLGLLGCIVIGLTGCATQSYFNSTISSWKGAPASDLTKKWGYPKATLSLANGKTYVYQQKIRVARGWYNHCHIYFTLNNAGKVSDIHAEGSDCLFTQGQYQSLAYHPQLRQPLPNS